LLIEAVESGAMTIAAGAGGAEVEARDEVRVEAKVEARRLIEGFLFESLLCLIAVRIPLGEV
jgi:hypothetical protein